MKKMWIKVMGCGLILIGITAPPAKAQDKPAPVIYGKPANAYVKGLKDTDPGRRVKALYALSRLGPEAKGSVPEMLKIIKDEKDISVRRAYLFALKKIDPAAAGKVGGR